MIRKTYPAFLGALLALLLSACLRPASQGPLGVTTVFPTATAGITPVTPALPEAILPPSATATPTPAETGFSASTPAFPELSGLLTRSRFGVHQYDTFGYAQNVPNIPPVFHLAVSPGSFAFSILDDLYVFNAGSAEPINLSSSPDRIERMPAWLPGEPARLLCLSTDADSQDPHYLTLLGPNPGDYEILDPDQSVAAFSISPDGSQVAFDGGRIYSLDTGQTRTFTAADYGLLDPPGLRLGAPAWSPDGRWLAWNTGYTQDGGFMESVILIDLDLGAAFALPFYLTVDHDGLSPPPLWSPDGRFLALDVHAQDASLAGVWIYPAGGAPGAEFRLDADLGSAVGQAWAWSPDGAKLAVTSDVLESDGIYLFETGDWSPHEYAAPGSVLAWVE